MRPIGIRKSKHHVSSIGRSIYIYQQRRGNFWNCVGYKDKGTSNFTDIILLVRKLR